MSRSDAEMPNAPTDVPQRDDEGKEEDSGYKEYKDKEEEDEAYDS